MPVTAVCEHWQIYLLSPSQVKMSEMEKPNPPFAVMLCFSLVLHALAIFYQLNCSSFSYLPSSLLCSSCNIQNCQY